MSGRAFLWRFGRDVGGAGAAEFALILPLFLLFLVGLIDAGRLFYDINRGEKATQIGARWAVVTDTISPQLTSKSYVGEVVGGVALTQGDRIPAAALGLISCNSTSCTCTTGPCPPSLTRNAVPFNNLLARMQEIMRCAYFGALPNPPFTRSYCARRRLNVSWKSPSPGLAGTLETLET
jgi:hypothetical protein